MQTEHTSRAHPVAGRWPLTPWTRALAWGLLSFLGFFVAFATLVWPISQLEQAVGLPHPVYLGLWALTWVLSSGALALVAARFAFGRWLEVRPAAWLLLIGGAVASAAMASILADWTITRFGINESELAGPMSLLFAVIAGVAVAGFGVQVAPRFAASAPLLAAGVGVALALAIIGSNIPGLADGLGVDSGPLAAATVAAALYGGVVAVLSFTRLRRA